MQPINLKQKYGKKYVIKDDGTNDSDKVGRLWCQIILCRRGSTKDCVSHIYIHSDTNLGIYINSPQIFKQFQAKFKDIIKPHQLCDTEATFIFHENHINTIAKFMKAKRKRKLSKEQLEKAVARLKPYHFKRK